MRRALPIAVAIFLAGTASYLLSRLEAHETPRAEGASAALIADAGPPTALAEIDRNIAFYQERAEATPRAWMDFEYVASGYMARARLTGDYNDWRRAEDAIEASFRSVGYSFGPYITRATFNATMHRYDRVEADLDAAEHGLLRLSDSDAVQSLRTDTRYYTGRYAEALERYDAQLVRSHRGLEDLVLLAQLDWHTGHFDEAVGLLDEAAQARGSSRATVRAWVLMMRATMERDRARYDDALAAIESARDAVPDDPHRDELEAEIHELRGEDDEALRLFRALAASSSSPQAIDGVARILARRGDEVAANELVALARQTYETQIALFPEAAYGHAIDHWLRLEADDVDRMITIAEGNALARPYGETRTKLAMAYLLAHRVADARRELDAVLATEWTTAELHAVNAITLAREGRDATAEEAAAEAIAPGVMDRFAWLTDGSTSGSRAAGAW
jgi:hypothetical protein